MGDARWHVLYVRRRFDEIVALNLDKLNVDHYVPTQGSACAQGGGSLLFPGFIFCKFDDAVYNRVLTIPGVLSVLRCAESFQAEQIEHLQRVINSGLPYKPWAISANGHWMKVENGLLSGVRGIIADGADRRLLIISIGLISRCVAVEVDGNCRLSPCADADPGPVPVACGQAS